MAGGNRPYRRFQTFLRRWAPHQPEPIDRRIHQGPDCDRVNGRTRSALVIEVLSRLLNERSVPAILRSDDGPEFMSKALLSQIVGRDIGTALIEPGALWQNGVAAKLQRKVPRVGGAAIVIRYLRT